MNDTFSHNGISRFILSSYCPVCQTEVEADLTILGDANGFGFRNNISLLCRSPTIIVGWASCGTPLYVHRQCGGILSPRQARPVLENGYIERKGGKPGKQL